MIRALIVDDEPLARRGIRLRLAEHPDIEVAGEAEDGPAAVRMITALLPDLVFLDVQMPGMNGFDVLAEVAEIHLPVIVFVTAYDQYAVNAFEVRALDYLLKPFTKDRFDEALRRARGELADGARPAAELLATRLTVRKGDRYLLVKIDDVDWLEAAGNYVEVHARGAEYLIRATLASLEKRLDPQRFVRIHRSAIVNADRVAEIRSDAHGDFDVTLAGGKVLRMTRNFSERLMGRA
jgi:two-component system, LytTR family, response regulator